MALIRKRNVYLKKQFRKWQDDREFVAEYKMGVYKDFFINGIHFMY